MIKYGKYIGAFLVFSTPCLAFSLESALNLDAVCDHLHAEVQTVNIVDRISEDILGSVRQNTAISIGEAISCVLEQNRVGRERDATEILCSIDIQTTTNSSLVWDVSPNLLLSDATGDLTARDFEEFSGVAIISNRFADLYSIGCTSTTGLDFWSRDSVPGFSPDLATPATIGQPLRILGISFFDWDGGSTPLEIDQNAYRALEEDDRLLYIVETHFGMIYFVRPKDLHFLRSGEYAISQLGVPNGDEFCPEPCVFGAADCRSPPETTASVTSCVGPSYLGNYAVSHMGDHDQLNICDRHRVTLWRGTENGTARVDQNDYELDLCAYRFSQDGTSYRVHTIASENNGESVWIELLERVEGNRLWSEEMYIADPNGNLRFLGCLQDGELTRSAFCSDEFEAPDPAAVDVIQSFLPSLAIDSGSDNSLLSDLTVEPSAALWFRIASGTEDYRSSIFPSSSLNGLLVAVPNLLRDNTRDGRCIAGFSRVEKTYFIVRTRGGVVQQSPVATVTAVSECNSGGRPIYPHSVEIDFSPFGGGASLIIDWPHACQMEGMSDSDATYLDRLVFSYGFRVCLQPGPLRNGAFIRLDREDPAHVFNVESLISQLINESLIEDEASILGPGSESEREVFMGNLLRFLRFLVIDAVVSFS